MLLIKILMWTEFSTCTGLRLKQVIKKLANKFLNFEKARTGKKVIKLEKATTEVLGGR